MTYQEKRALRLRVGAVLRAKRDARGETLVEVSRRVGVARQNYARMERGVHAARLETIVRAARTLGCRPIDVLAEALEGIE